MITSNIEELREKVHSYYNNMDPALEGLEDVWFTINENIFVVFEADLMTHLKKFDWGTPTNYLNAILLGLILSAAPKDGTILVDMDNFRRANGVLECWSDSVPTEVMGVVRSYPLRCNFMNKRESTLKRTFRLRPVVRHQHCQPPPPPPSQ